MRCQACRPRRNGAPEADRLPALLCCIYQTCGAPTAEGIIAMEFVLGLFVPCRKETLSIQLAGIVHYRLISLLTTQNQPLSPPSSYSLFTNPHIYCSSLYRSLLVILENFFGNFGKEELSCRIRTFCCRNYIL